MNRSESKFFIDTFFGTPFSPCKHSHFDSTALNRARKCSLFYFCLQVKLFKIGTSNHSNVNTSVEHLYGNKWPRVEFFKIQGLPQTWETWKIWKTQEIWKIVKISWKTQGKLNFCWKTWKTHGNVQYVARPPMKMHSIEDFFLSCSEKNLKMLWKSQEKLREFSFSKMRSPWN